MPNNLVQIGKDWTNNSNYFSVLPRLKKAFPTAVPFQSNFSLTCSVEGKPIPKITWKIDRRSLLGFQENVIEIETVKGSPLIIESDYQDAVVVSTLIVKNIGLCLNASVISCWAGNQVQDSKKMHEFFISRGMFSII